MKFVSRVFSIHSISGFSLVELMVVIAIIGVVSAISIPALINPEHKARKAATGLMGDMQQTRMSAIKENQNWAIVFDPAKNTYLICSNPGPDNDWSDTADNTIEKIVKFTNYAAGIQYGNGTATTNATESGGAFPTDFVSYPSNILTFNPWGTCPAGYVYLTYGDVSYAIGTLSTGLIRVKRWTGGSWK